MIPKKEAHKQAYHQFLSPQIQQLDDNKIKNLDEMQEPCALKARTLALIVYV